jgi:hypothetical protein
MRAEVKSAMDITKLEIADCQPSSIPSALFASQDQNYRLEWVDHAGPIQLDHRLPHDERLLCRHSDEPLTEKQSPWFNRWHEDKATDCFRLLIKRKRRKKDISECFRKVLRNDEIPSFYHGEGGEKRGKKVKVGDFSCEEEKNLRKTFFIKRFAEL